MTSDEVRKVIIIGSGPAGYTAAVYTARAALTPLLVEGVVSGGALMNTTEVENYPGFADGIMGPELMDAMRAQAERFGAEIISDDATSVDLESTPKVVQVGDRTFYGETVILATGSAYRHLGLLSEDKLAGHGVSWCATCDGFFFRDQDILVVGGGDSAMEEATFLSRFARSVTVVHRREKLRASKIMQARAFDDPKIGFRFDTELVEILGDTKVSGVRLRDVHSGAETEVAATGVFIAIGHDPRNELFKGQVELDAEGYVVVDHPSTRTNLPGVFAAGDLVDHNYRQAVTAAGTGCAAALDAEHYLAALGATATPLSVIVT